MAAGGHHGSGGLGDGAAGVFHQGEAGDIVGNSAAVGLAHFRRRQQLVHANTMFPMRYFQVADAARTCTR